MITIYVDGACKTSDKTGGWAFVVLKDGEKIYSEFNSEDNTTNNRMEVMACIKALEYCLNNDIEKVTLVSDSMYVIGTMSKGWKKGKNHDLWRIMDDLCERVKIMWQHVKGHNGDKYNSLCDSLATVASNYKKIKKV
jgi:ribonuclease HI